MEERVIAGDVCVGGIGFLKNIITLMLFAIKKHTFAPTVPVLHTIRTAIGSFFLYSYGKQTSLHHSRPNISAKTTWDAFQR